MGVSEVLLCPYRCLEYKMVRLQKLTRKPCYRKETARCPKCSFRLKFANNIPYKHKTSHASKATLQSSKHAGAKTQFNAKSGFKVIQSHVFGVSGKAVRQ